MTVAASADFVSIGQLACRLQRSVRQIEAAAQALELPPAMRLNLVPYFSGEQTEQLTNYLSKEAKR